MLDEVDCIAYTPNFMISSQKNPVILRILGCK